MKSRNHARSAGQIFIGDDKKELEERVLQCVPEGASFEEVMRTNFVGTPKDCIKQLRQNVNLSVTHFILFFGDLPDLNGLRLFAKKVVQKMK